MAEKAAARAGSRAEGAFGVDRWTSNGFGITMVPPTAEKMAELDQLKDEMAAEPVPARDTPHVEYVEIPLEELDDPAHDNLHFETGQRVRIITNHDRPGIIRYAYRDLQAQPPVERYEVFFLNGYDVIDYAAGCMMLTTADLAPVD